MIVRLRTWWVEIKTHRVTILVVVVASVLVVAIALIIAGYRFDWTGFNGTYKSGKTLWDWLQLLIIPVALALIAFWFNRVERKNEQAIATDNQQEAALQAYIDKMSELLLHENLRESDPEKEIRKIARVRTLMVLPRLNNERKRSVLQFLYESGLIDKDKSIVDLYKASLYRADLRGVKLYKADLHGADLLEADLNGADLREANLSEAFLNFADFYLTNLREANLGRAQLVTSYLIEANLKGANLCEADLWGANLRGANLTKANLDGADLSETDLTKANLEGANVTEEQLKTARSLKGATMPDGSIHP